MWHLRCDTWQVTSEMWYLTCDKGHMTHGGMVWYGVVWYGEHYETISSYDLGMVKKWHARGNIIDNIHSISIAWGKKGHKGGVRGPRSSFGGKEFAHFHKYLKHQWFTI